MLIACLGFNTPKRNQPMSMQLSNCYFFMHTSTFSLVINAGSSSCSLACITMRCPVASTQVCNAQWLQEGTTALYIVLLTSFSAAETQTPSCVSHFSGEHLHTVYLTDSMCVIGVFV
uniref:Uncharacterized protein n=1 Tax=Eutreptiella gymnastica TaxID=73025 RepID=A0A7S4G6U1_9EUGL